MMPKIYARHTPASRLVTVQTCRESVIASAARQSRWRKGVRWGRHCCYGDEIAAAQAPRDDNLSDSEHLPRLPLQPPGIVQSHCQKQDLPDFEIFRMFINPENPLILVILLLTFAAGMNLAIDVRPLISSPALYNPSTPPTSPIKNPLHPVHPCKFIPSRQIGPARMTPSPCPAQNVCSILTSQAINPFHRPGSHRSRPPLSATKSLTASAGDCRRPF